MNFFIAVMLLLSAAGLADKLLNGRFGLAEEFDRGLVTMGPLSVSMLGIYCIGITAVQSNPGAVAKLAAALPFDPSLLIGCLLAPDLGGWSIAGQIAASAPLAQFSGVLLASSLGTLISFMLPIALSSLPKQEIPAFMRGLLWGVVTMPLCLVPGGVLLGLSAGQLAVNMAPILLLCTGLWLALRFAPGATTTVLLVLGNIIRAASILLFGAVMAGLFIPSWALCDSLLVSEAFVIVAKITVVVCGAMILSRILLAQCGRFLMVASQKLRINQTSVVGLVVSLATGVSMLSLFSGMDRRGKAMNAAFTVCGSFMLGGQLAFIASVEDASLVAVFLISKVLGGVGALLAAWLVTPGEEKEAEKERSLAEAM